ncbi:YdbC family protein [Clostridium tunisiense]|uniref:YdbC family protein n=1 Tax=Clostridium tunisiense TaxID=219748 RepID=UPI0002D9965D|nr:PC4/YdbC family ssDNA-binding protein [Clostridium tunisiense]
MADIKFEIKENTGVLSESAKGWKKELNLISWNDKEAKYDIRDWDSEHKKMGKGVTLNIDELKALKEILNGMELLK